MNFNVVLTRLGVKEKQHVSVTSVGASSVITPSVITGGGILHLPVGQLLTIVPSVTMYR